MTTSPRVLAVRFGSLGDVVLTTPLLRAIRLRHPDASITFVTKRAYAPLFAGHPHVDQVVALEPGESVRSLARRLAATTFDHRLDLHGNLRSAVLRRYLPGRWSGFDKHRLERWQLLWLGGPGSATRWPAAERYFAAARALNVRPDGGPAEVFPSDADRRTARALAAPPYVALAPGARHRTKRWPRSHWRALAALLGARGFGVVAVGAAHERRLLDAPGVVSAFVESLGATAALLQGAAVTVCNDSGLMHLATAVRGRVVALFGPTVQGFGFAPYRARAVVLEHPLGCRPCSAKGSAFCPLGHHRCLRGIDPTAAALAAVDLVHAA